MFEVKVGYAIWTKRLGWFAALDRRLYLCGGKGGGHGVWLSVSDLPDDPSGQRGGTMNAWSGEELVKALGDG